MTCTQRFRFSLAIRIILFLLIALAPAAAFCGQLTLAWTKNSESDIVGYRIFCREENSSYNYSQPSWEGSETSCVISDLDDNRVYYSVVRAYNTAGIESLNSNEVSAQITSPEPTPTEPTPTEPTPTEPTPTEPTPTEPTPTEPNSPDSPPEVIIDNGDPGTSWDGSWGVSSGPNSYENTSVYNLYGDTYTFEQALTGYYEVSLWWTYHSNRCTRVDVDIYDGSSFIETIEVNQQFDTGQWNALGKYEFRDTARVVIHSNSYGCSTSVDGIRFVSAQKYSPSEVIIDNGDPGTSWNGSWAVSSGPNSYENTSVYNLYGDTYTFEQALTGYYEVSLWWTYHSNRCTRVDVDIYDGSSFIETIEVNQQFDTGQWNALGKYEFRDTARVVIHSNSYGCSTSVDGIRFVADDTRFISAYDDTFQTSSSCQASPILSENSFYKSVAEGETVTLNDIDNLKTDYTIVAYYWEQLVGEPVTLSDSSAAVPTFTAPIVDENGTELIFAVEVTTSDNRCDTAEIVIDIEDYNDRNYTENSGPNDSGGCFISINTGSVLGSFSKKTFLFYNIMILLLAVLSLCLIYSLSKKIGRKY